MAYSPSNAFHWERGRTVKTTDATATSIISAPIRNLSPLTLKGIINAERTGGTSGTVGDIASYEITVTGTARSGAVFVSPITFVHVYEDQPAWNITTSVSNNVLSIQVTGAANNNVTWNSVFWKVENA